MNVAVDSSGSRPRVDTSAFLPASPDPAYSQPTTRYVSRRELPTNAVAADAAQPKVQHAHWPLVVLLVCTQTALGLSLAWTASVWFDRSAAGRVGWPAVAMGAVGLVSSVLHLGRPERAWRVFLGWRTSWLSREAIGLGGWIPLLAVAVWRPGFVPLVDLLTAVALVVGGCAVCCSAMIYIDTPRRFWRAPATSVRMGTTVLVAALVPVAPAAAAVALIAKVGFEWRQRQSSSSWGVLLRASLRWAFGLRCALAAGAVVGLLVGSVTESWPSTVVVTAAAIVWFAGEIVERSLFFRAVDRSKMPGVAAA